MSARIRSASLAAACVLVGLVRFGSVAYAQSFTADLDTIEAGGGLSTMRARLTTAPSSFSTRMGKRRSRSTQMELRRFCGEIV